MRSVVLFSFSKTAIQNKDGVQEGTALDLISVNRLTFQVSNLIIKNYLHRNVSNTNVLKNKDNDLRASLNVPVPPCKNFVKYEVLFAAFFTCPILLNAPHQSHS